jgi:flagellar hook protein FlgE
MSLYGALNIGVAGLAANSAALSATSSNIANVNTVGYKDATANFETFLNTPGLVGNSSAGVSAVIGQDVTTQGLPTATSSPTDMSISGNGFFVVATNPSAGATQEYTRAGSFTPDSDGNLVNAAGLYLLGYKLDSSGAVPTDTTQLNLVNVTSLSGKAQATTKLGIQANLQSSSTVDSTYATGDMTSGAVTPDFQRTINVYDSQGGSQPITMSFIKTGANQWAYEASYAGDSANISGTNPIGTGTVSFNSDGTLANVNGAATPTGSFNLTIPWAASTGLSSQTVAVNLGTVGGTSGLTQFDTASTLNGTSPDGSPFGNVTGVTIAKDGTVTAQFSNGLQQDVYKIPIATFTNPDGLAQANGNAYIATKNSGAANVNLANTGAAGGIASQSLEGSTVDLATEFTNLITTQRAYSASARIITTADQMLQELEQLPSS